MELTHSIKRRDKPSTARVRWAGWAVLAASLLALPHAGSGSAWLSFLCLTGTLAVFCLSYNLLLGEGGMLSFGHAVYSGLGAFCSVYAMNIAAAGAMVLPVPLVPLVGGVAGAVFGIVLGYVATKRSGTGLAMMTLGIGELVYTLVQMLPQVFGGEGGITTNRTYGPAMLGLTFGPQIQVYYLIAAWLVLCTWLTRLFVQTPLGRILNAARDNPERAEFIGYDPRRVRYLVFIVSAFFAGVSGGLAAINLEIVTGESVSTWRSGDALLFTYMGGTGSFVGPIVGAVFGNALVLQLSEVTRAWQLYLGAFFIAFVMYAPEGLTGLARDCWYMVRPAPTRKRTLRWMGATLAAIAMFVAGAGAIVEILYAQVFRSQEGAMAKWLALASGAERAMAWLVAVLLLCGSAVLLRWMRPRLAKLSEQALATSGPRGKEGEA
ncbi:branched-chain amino acid ABC transporter permease [Variovorax sp. WS11]|uniref:branched-chain amino acid ABC transporter permease n=1 Tax=Variovorax sp. WS11 TaxID=1105204 RepID=UPI000D0D5FCC|nr:branched-chain amino acid ABC transporter permease [Variovorax sp. WS11]NDZ18924.1 branched-chain amino acid ABC transporter permease [Variovorax sp. WS11]PSL82435.1 branched-chain amino acid ABC transporter permease [Variovorax sp. WS11]